VVTLDDAETAKPGAIRSRQAIGFSANAPGGMPTTIVTASAAKTGVMVTSVRAATRSGAGLCR